jgi:uncharacterized membrane protein
MIRRGWVLLVVGFFFLLTVSPVRAQAATVKAILFYNPGCGACKTLINEVLPPLLVQYGSSLSILTIDVTNPEGDKLYQAALSSLAIPSGKQGVPLLVVESTYLSGLDDIRGQLPGMIEQKLAQGGSDWPPIPGLNDALQKAGFSTAPSSAWERFLADQPANTLAVIVLLGLLLSLLFSILIVFRPAPKFLYAIPAWVFPVLLGVGFAVASYLTYAELTQSKVFCGGISHCQEVQDSPYSRIFGLVTVGEFGLVGYILVGIAWLVHRYAHGVAKTIAAIAMFGFAVFGVSFSFYLTFLEPFVIGATCLWCLSSATIMGLILPLTTLVVQSAMQPYLQAAKGNRRSGE